MTVDLLCMGEPMLEFNQLPANPDGSRHYLEGHGGDTSNAAIAAAMQGARVGYISAVGNDMPGDAFMALWAREGVDSTTVRRDPGNQTRVYFVTHAAAGHHFLHYRANSPAAMMTADDVPAAAIRSARMLYASGISQGISLTARAVVARAISIATLAGVPVAYDTNYRPRLWSPEEAARVMVTAIRQVTHALPGIEDARAMTGLTEPDAIVDLYLDLGPKVVVLKMGDAGAYVATATQRVRIPAFPVTTVDATGGALFATPIWRGFSTAMTRYRRPGTPPLPPL